MQNSIKLKNKKEYIKLLLLTNITGAYNLYLNKNKKACTMMLILIISLILIMFYGLGLLGIIFNTCLLVADLVNLKEDLYNYNANIIYLINKNDYKDKLFIKKSHKEYRKITLIFGIIGLEDFYLDDYSLKNFRFIVNSIYLFVYGILMSILYVGMLYIMIKYPDPDIAQGAMWMIVFFIWGIMILLAPILIIAIPVSYVLIPCTVIYTLYKIISNVHYSKKIISIYNNFENDDLICGEYY